MRKPTALTYPQAQMMEEIREFIQAHHPFHPTRCPAKVPLYDIAGKYIVGLAKGQYIPFGENPHIFFPAEEFGRQLHVEYAVDPESLAIRLVDLRTLDGTPIDDELLTAVGRWCAMAKSEPPPHDPHPKPDPSSRH